MKQPRTEGFDPNAHAKPKQLKSSLDNMPTIESQPITHAPSPPPEQLPRTPVHPVLPVRDVRPAQSVRRKIKSRHPFDIYEDQDEALRQLSIEDRMRGGAGSMSAMVREAIDDYIAKVRQQN